MKYDNLTHKIETIWNKTEENSTNLNRVKSINRKNPTNYNAKKIFSLETDWEKMEVFAHYDINDEIDYYGAFYKTYEITIVNFPLRFLNCIDCCVLYQYTMPAIDSLNLSGSSSKFVYIYDLDTTEEINDAVKTVKIYVSHLLAPTSNPTTKYQVYSKLKMTIANNQSYK